MVGALCCSDRTRMGSECTRALSAFPCRLYHRCVHASFQLVKWLSARDSQIAVVLAELQHESSCRTYLTSYRQKAVELACRSDHSQLATLSSWPPKAAGRALALGTQNGAISSSCDGALTPPLHTPAKWLPLACRTCLWRRSSPSSVPTLTL
jgi:hypothetical protein